MIDPNQHDRFVLRQRFKMVINHYVFSIPDGSEGDGEPFCFVEQKRFKFKEDIRFFTDETKSQELMKILARQRFDPRAKYDITDAAGGKIGMIQKVFGKSLFRSTYTLFDPQGDVVATVRERNLFTAIFRRLVGLVPYVGDFADWLPIPYHFDFTSGETLLGTHSRRRWKFTDIYDMDFTADIEHRLDRRLVLATAVGLDALQAR
ncbi:MAG: hypothetical protein WAL70_05225 [Aeromicrobium sp.]